MFFLDPLASICLTIFPFIVKKWQLLFDTYFDQLHISTKKLFISSEIQFYKLHSEQKPAVIHVF